VEVPVTRMEQLILNSIRAGASRHDPDLPNRDRGPALYQEAVERLGDDLGG